MESDLQTQLLNELGNDRRAKVAITDIDGGFEGNTYTSTSLNQR